MEEVAKAVRFVIVGAINTAVGYAIILVSLFAGLGDYAANATGFALGLPISWAMHRHFTFAVKARPNVAEGVRFAIALAISYCANLMVLYAGRSLGYTESPIVQGIAIAVYAAVMFVISRLFVFNRPEDRLPRRN